MELDLTEIFKLQADKLITVREHPAPDVDLYIANYTPQVQFDKLWGKHPLLPLCRGLIFDGKGHVVARPFEKFFNYGEYDGPIPDGKFTVTEKMDGSLGILYWVRDTPYIATRGSFSSEQAVEGTRILHEKYEKHYYRLKRDKTYLFEIIYPENRIVVDYSGVRDLWLLAIIDTDTGEETRFPEPHQSPWPLPELYTDKAVLDELEVEPDKEGYVVRYDNGLRLKVKGEEYLRLHKIMTGITDKRIWESLKNGDNLSVWYDNVPDEFSKELREKVREFREAYERKAAAALRIFDRIMEGFNGFAYPDRAQFAMEAKKHPCADILFLMFDNKDWSGRIWKMLEPKGVTA